MSGKSDERDQAESGQAPGRRVCYGDSKAGSKTGQPQTGHRKPISQAPSQKEAISPTRRFDWLAIGHLGRMADAMARPEISPMGHVRGVLDSRSPSKLACGAAGSLQARRGLLMPRTEVGCARRRGTAGDCQQTLVGPDGEIARVELQFCAVVIGAVVCRLSGVGQAKLGFDQRCQRQICILEPIPHQPRSLVERRCVVESCDKARLDTKPDRGQGHFVREDDGRPCHATAAAVASEPDGPRERTHSTALGRWPDGEGSISGGQSHS